MEPRAGQAAVKASCQQTTAVDYEKPLRMLPRLPQPPRNRPLPFAKHRVFADVVDTIVQTGRGRIGLALRAPHIPANGFLLNWKLAIELSRVSRHGGVRKVLGEQKRRLKKVHRNSQLDLSLSLDYPPGLYRYRVVIRDRGNKVLAEYGQYARVLPPTLKVGLGLNKRAFRGGEDLLAQIINYGTESVSFGKGAIFERYENGDWVKTNLFPMPRVQRRAVGVTAGVRGPCEEFDIPEDTPAGTYRLRKEIFTLFLANARTVTASFAVSA
jgi:hypothetical protein